MNIHHEQNGSLQLFSVGQMMRIGSCVFLAGETGTIINERREIVLEAVNLFQNFVKIFPSKVKVIEQPLPWISQINFVRIIIALGIDIEIKCERCISGCRQICVRIIKDINSELNQFQYQ